MLRLLHVFQALIYPLTVASKSNVPARQTAANKILKNMCEHSNTLVQQAMLVIKIQMSYTHITLSLLLKQYCKFFLFRNLVTKNTFLCSTTISYFICIYYIYCTSFSSSTCLVMSHTNFKYGSNFLETVFK